MSIHVEYLIIPLFFGLLFGALFHVLYKITKQAWAEISSTLLFMCSGISLLLLILSLSFMEINSFNTVAIKRGEQIRIISQDCFYKLGQDEKIIDFNRSMEVAMVVHPVTENPKVRNFRIKVSIQVAPTIEEARKLDNILHNEELPIAIRTPEKIIEFHLYEFVERNSKALAGFYNPLDSEQQREFRVLFEPYLEGKLKDYPLKITSSQFEILP